MSRSSSKRYRSAYNGDDHDYGYVYIYMCGYIFVQSLNQSMFFIVYYTYIYILTSLYFIICIYNISAPYHNYNREYVDVTRPTYKRRAEQQYQRPIVHDNNRRNKYFRRPVQYAYYDNTDSTAELSNDERISASKRMRTSLNQQNQRQQYYDYDNNDYNSTDDDSDYNQYYDYDENIDSDEYGYTDSDNNDNNNSDIEVVGVGISNRSKHDDNDNDDDDIYYEYIDSDMPHHDDAYNTSDDDDSESQNDSDYSTSDTTSSSSDSSSSDDDDENENNTTAILELVQQSDHTNNNDNDIDNTVAIIGHTAQTDTNALTIANNDHDDNDNEGNDNDDISEESVSDVGSDSDVPTHTITDLMNHDYTNNDSDSSDDDSDYIIDDNNNDDIDDDDDSSDDFGSDEEEYLTRKIIEQELKDRSKEIIQRAIKQLSTEISDVYSRVQRRTLQQRRYHDDDIDIDDSMRYAKRKVQKLLHNRLNNLSAEVAFLHSDLGDENIVEL